MMINIRYSCENGYVNNNNYFDSCDCAIIFFIAKFYKNTFGYKRPKLSYNERLFLQANLDLELDEDDISDRYVRAGGRE